MNFCLTDEAKSHSLTKVDEQLEVFLKERSIQLELHLVVLALIDQDLQHEDHLRGAVQRTLIFNLRCVIGK